MKSKPMSVLRLANQEQEHSFKTAIRTRVLLVLTARHTLHTFPLPYV
ncbi:hypothetical protein SAMN05216302_1003139 [Nitrosomonas aestuarii]|uniref:Uncharacterized protein n=1 Tax=Nitrosomonas aestuarii TaxID=52441 RepID=A0A1I3YE74_9PROT|nr:hypothetical protein [Nitrosomonas aestuarii]SFK29591.1 hypothetical protein SAMN05216302_1003139 [Nitrosomonas aestuarii]